MSKMRYTRHTDSISIYNVDICMQNVQIFLFNHGYTFRESERMMSALAWYIYTGRASALFLHKFVVSMPSKVGNAVIKYHALPYDGFMEKLFPVIGYDVYERTTI